MMIGRKIFHTWVEAERMIADKLVNIEPIISHDLPLARYSNTVHSLSQLMSTCALSFIVMMKLIVH
jgi:hypothetical protein